MSGFVGWRRGSAALLLLAAVGAAASTASARQAVKKPPQRPVPAVAVAAITAAPARFFTIDEILAERDARIAAGGNAAMGASPARATVHLANASTADTALERGRHDTRHDEPFGLFTFRAPEGRLWIKWRGVNESVRKEAEELASCRGETSSSSCSTAARKFLAIAAAARAAEGRARVDIVNRAVNASIRYTSDFTQHRAADVWTAPLATLAAGRGDCEDYAIAKYAILREAGVPVDDLRLVLVRDRAVGQDHAVLAVRDGGRWLVLDNRHSMLVEATRLPHFKPLFALDHNGVNLFAAPYYAAASYDFRPTLPTEPAAPVPPDAETEPRRTASLTTPYGLRGTLN